MLAALRCGGREPVRTLPLRRRMDWSGLWTLLAALLVAGMLGWAVAELGATDLPESELLCISTVGPVDQDGKGDTTPEQVGPECPAEGGATP